MAAITSVAISAVTAGASFAQAANQAKKETEAKEAAQKAMDEARKRLEVNVYSKLGIQKEPYELQREALLSTGAQAIEAGAESERGAAATAGRIAMAENEAQAGVRTAMGKELSDLEKLTAQEQGRLLDIGTQLNLEEVAGAQQAEADAAAAKRAAMAQGFQSVAQGVQQAAQEVNLYGKTKAVREANRIERKAMGDRKGQYGLSQGDMQKSIAGMGTVNNVDLSKVGSMTPTQYADFMGSLDVGTLNQIRSNLPNYATSFNPNVQPIGRTGGIVNPFAIYQ